MASRQRHRDRMYRFDASARGRAVCRSACTCCMRRACSGSSRRACGGCGRWVGSRSRSCRLLAMSTKAFGELAECLLLGQSFRCATHISRDPFWKGGRARSVCTGRRVLLVDSGQRHCWEPIDGADEGGPEPDGCTSVIFSCTNRTRMTSGELLTTLRASKIAWLEA